jgi:hypothetical protein
MLKKSKSGLNYNQSPNLTGSKNLSALLTRCTIAGLLLWLLALAPAMAQTVVHRGETTELSVEQQPGDTSTWELYNDSTVNFAVVQGTAVTDGDAQFVGANIGASVNVRWNETGLYFIKVTGRDVSGCTNNVKIIWVEVLNEIPTAILLAGPAVCEGEPISLAVTLTGTAPWRFTYTDGVTEWTVTDVLTNTYVLVINPGPATTTSYWITNVTDNYETNTVPGEGTSQQINPLPAPSNIFHN